jgi:heptaprenyl diphosphate synthase
MKTRRITRLGLLSAGAVASYVFEGMIPVPIPWARIGMSNVFVLIGLFGFGPKDALAIALVRVVAGNLLLGILLSPAFLFSLTGGLTALAVMSLVRARLVPPLSVIGASCAGAVGSNLVQVVLFSALFTSSGVVLKLLGGFMVLGAAVGLVTGFIAARVLDHVELER